MKNKLNISAVVLALFGFVAVQTTVAQATNTSPAQEALKGMRPFIGNWTGESESFVEFEGLEGDGKIHWTMRFRWLQNKAAVEYTWQSKYKNTGKNFTTGSQIVSLDAATGKLRTIGYGHDGDVYWSNLGSVETKNKSFTQIVDEITINKTKSKYIVNYTKDNPKKYSINITKIADQKELKLPVINLHRVVKASGSAVSAGEAEKITEVLTKLSIPWGKASLTKDTDHLKRIWADDFSYIGADGVVSDKEANLAVYEDDNNTYTSAANTAFNVRVYSKNFAVTDGDTYVVGKDKDGKPFSKKWRFSNVWVRKNGKWQVVAGHASQLE
ncbi:MAG: nuclear transport factor 2 family protein [Rhodospirillales bacterium]|nr:nuclear transport factor 2 family protein [Rhodospirillales bacterium]